MVAVQRFLSQGLKLLVLAALFGAVGLWVGFMLDSTLGAAIGCALSWVLLLTLFLSVERLGRRGLRMRLASPALLTTADRAVAGQFVSRLWVIDTAGCDAFVLRGLWGKGSVFLPESTVRNSSELELRQTLADLQARVSRGGYSIQSVAAVLLRQLGHFESPRSRADAVRIFLTLWIRHCFAWLSLS